MIQGSIPAVEVGMAAEAEEEVLDAADAAVMRRRRVSALYIFFLVRC